MAEFIYPWAANPVKALRAIENVKKAEKEVTEDEVRKEYELLGGRLVKGFVATPKTEEIVVAGEVEEKARTKTKVSKSSKKASK